MIKLTWAERFRMIWSVLIYGVPTTGNRDWVMNVDLILKDVHTGCVRRALNKMNIQPKVEGRYHLATEGAGLAKRAEVLEWAERFCSYQGVSGEDLNHWKLNFALEFLVGQEKGIL